MNDYYFAAHAPRYAFLLNLLSPYISGKNIRLLDIGASALTGMMHDKFDIPVDTIGFGDDGPRPTGQHYHFDLNKTQSVMTWRKDIPIYDIINMAEVIEHLYTSPTLVLKFLRTILANDGLLIMQTPNAVRLINRIKMLLGYNPFELIRENNENPGHFRELTLQEIRSYAQKTGFSVEKYDISEYFDRRYPSGEINGIPQHTAPTWRSTVMHYMARPLKYLPENLRSGITVVLRKK